MSFTKLSVSPAIWQAIATAASLPLGTIKPYSRSLSVSWSPVLRLAMDEPDTVIWDSSGTVTISSRAPFSRAIRQVSILVVDAGYILL